MGWFKKIVKKGEAKVEAALNKGSEVAPPAFDPENPPTRWEKAVLAVNGIVQQVSKIDPDGIDVFCFPGVNPGDVDAYRNLKNTEGLKDLVTAKEPGGPCHMTPVMDMVFQEAFSRGFERPCSVLVLTAGRPDDHEQVSESIAKAAKALEKDSDLTVTFVQIGDDEWAEKYLKHLDDDLTCVSATGETIDIVDTIKDEDIQKAVGEAKKPGFMGSGGGGALMGAFAGAALGAGGVYLFNKSNAKKRTAGWNGQWKATPNDVGGEVVMLTVTDDMAGNITVEGWPGGGKSTGQYADTDDGYNIMKTAPDTEPQEDDEPVQGTVEDEHNIAWDDGTRWEEVPPEGESWAVYAGAAAAGAATAGSVGYLTQKKFFNKAAKKVPSDYVIVMDRSYMMLEKDTGH